MFYKNPFTKENAKSISTILAGIATVAGIQTTISAQADPVLQITFYVLALVLFFLKEKPQAR